MALSTAPTILPRQSPPFASLGGATDAAASVRYVANYFVNSNFIEKMAEFHGTFFCELLRHQSNGKK